MTSRPWQPLTDSELRLSDGRAVGYAVWGDPDGDPAVLCHGSPGSRMFSPDPAVTAELGVRLVTVDRPGYGRSTALPDQKFLDWPADLAELLDALGVGSCALLAHSAGSPYALACAVTMPARIRRVVLVSCVAPLDPGSPDVAFSDDEGERALVEMSRSEPERARAAIVEAVGWLAEDPDRFLTLPRPAPDVALLEQPAIRAMYAAAVREAVRQGLDAYAVDEVLCRRPWGFSLESTTCPVSIWHGERDVAVSAAHAYALSRLLPGSELQFDPEQAHGLLLADWAEIAAELRA